MPPSTTCKKNRKTTTTTKKKLSDGRSARTTVTISRKLDCDEGETRSSKTKNGARESSATNSITQNKAAVKEKPNLSNYNQFMKSEYGKIKNKLHAKLKPSTKAENTRFNQVMPKAVSAAWNQQKAKGSYNDTIYDGIKL